MAQIDFDEHKRLKILAAILPAAMARGLPFTVIEDLANRAVADGHFLISQTGELLGPPGADYVDEMSQRTDAAHLFAAAVTKESAADATTICGLSKPEFDKLKPEAKLKLANEYRQPKAQRRE